MKHFEIDRKKPDKTTIFKAAKILKEGGLIIYPTDTLYGIGANVFNEKAMQKLYETKDRDFNKPVSIMVNNLKMIESLVGDLSDYEKFMAETLFPGKLTLIFPIKKENKIFGLHNKRKIGFRIPESVICRELIENLGEPISTTSVNISRKPSILSVQVMIREFSEKIEGILDAGFLPPSIGSTVIDLTTNPATILRYGDVTISELKERTGLDFSTNFTNQFVITFVCSGNICRSPMAEGIMRKVIQKTKFRKIVKINSAGTLNLPVSAADFKAIEVSSENNIDISKHSSKPVNVEIIRESNIIICMALNHYSYLRKKYPEFKNKIILLKQYANTKQLINPSVADPIGHDMLFFNNTFSEIQREIKRILPTVLARIKQFTEDNNISLT